MKITCALSETQSQKLYKTIYKSLTEAVKSGEFDSEAYMADLFDKIADKKDEDTAVKFLQQVPSIIRAIAAKPAFDALDIKLDPIKELSLNFKNEAEGFNEVLKYFKPQMTQREKLALLKAKENQALLVPEVDPATEIKDPVRLRPFSGAVSVMQQLKATKPEDKKNLVEEQEDESRKRIYATLDAIRLAADESTSDDVIPSVVYMGEKIKLKPVLLSTLYDTNKSDLDATTLKQAEKTENAKAPVGVDSKNQIALVLSDENGNYIYFNEDGKVTSKDKGGKVVYQFMRDVRNDTGKYRLTNMFGYDSGVQTAEDIAKGLGITLEEAEELQQKEFKALYNIRQETIKGNGPLLDVYEVTPGVKESVAQKKITLQNLRQLPFVNTNTFRGIYPVMTGGNVSARISLQGKEYDLDRPNLPVDFANGKRQPGDLIKKIAAVLANPKLPNAKKYDFVTQFLSDNASPSTRRHILDYNQDTDTLTFIYSEKAHSEGGIPNITLVSNKEKNDLTGKESLIEDVLLNASKYAKGGMYSAKMTYNAKALERNGYFDYNMETGVLDKKFKPYIPLLETLPGTEVKMAQQTDLGFFNSHIKFGIPDSFVKEIEDAFKNPDPIDVKGDEAPTVAEKISELRAQEQRDLLEAIPNIESYKVNGTVDKNLMPAEELVKYNEIYDRYDKLITPLLNQAPTDTLDIEAQRADIEKKWKDQQAYYLKEIGDLEQWEKEKNAELAALETSTAEWKWNWPPVSQDDSINNAIAPENTTDPFNDFNDFIFRKGVDTNKVTEEQIKNAKEWWASSPLSKYMDFDAMVNIVNSDVYARFIGYASVLNGKYGKIDIGQRGTMVDVYHEAWHAFSQIFLTKEQREKLYKEVAKQPGSFTLLDGTTVAFKDAKFKQLEEYLAEDFRDYGINQSTKKGQPTRNTLFRQIYNFIKNFLTSKSTKDKLFKELYFAKSNPKFIKKYSPNIDTTSFKKLNRGVISLTDSTIDVLNRQDAKLASDSIDSYISEVVDIAAERRGSKSGSLVMLLGDQNKQAFYKLVKADFQEKLADARTSYEAIENNPDKAIEAARLLNKIRIFQAALDNFGDAKGGLVKYHLENTTFNLFKQKYIEAEEEVDVTDDVVEEEAKDQKVEGESSDAIKQEKIGKKSLLDLASKETISILKALHKIENGKPVYNELGYKVLADFSATWNNLMRAANGVKDPQQIYDNIKQAAIEVYPEFKQLIASKLPNPLDAASLPDLSRPGRTEKDVAADNAKIKNKIAETKILTNFWQDVQKTRVTYLQTTIFENQIAEVTKASIETASLANKFQAKFKSDLDNTFIDRSPENNIGLLNLEKIVAEYGENGELKTELSYRFARDIGIYLDNLRIIKSELIKDQKTREAYGLPFIYKLIVDLNAENKKQNITTESREAITKFRANPIESLMKGISADVFGKERSQKNKIEKLLGLQAKYGVDSSNFAVLNAERNLVFEHIDDHTVSMIVYALNKASNMKDFWTEGSELEYLSYLSPTINSFTNRSQVLNTLFDMATDMEKRVGKSLQLFVNSGTQLENGDGTNTTALDVKGKFLQEVHSMLKGGVQEFMRHASKSSSFGARIEGGILGGQNKLTDTRLWVDIDKFATGNAISYVTDNHMIPYIAAELERINKFKSNKDLFKTYAGYNRIMPDGTYAGENFTAFDNVLTDATKKEILSKVTDPNMKLEDYLENDVDLARKIEKEVGEYFEYLTEDTVDFYDEAPYMSPDLMDRLKKFNLTEEQGIKALLKAYTVNAWVQNFEMGNLFYGDLVQYNHEKEELHKRNTGSTSGGLKVRTDLAMQKFLTGLNGMKSYAATIPGMTTLKYTGKFNTAILQDIERDSIYSKNIEKALRKDYEERFAKSTLSKEAVTKEIDRRVALEVKKYEKMEEGDGQGWITIDAYRSLKMASGEWSDLQEELFTKIIENKPVSVADIVEMFPVYKAQNYGHLADTGLPVMAMHKFALAPMIPSMIKGSNLESLHNQMMTSNIQYVTFQTGSKVGSVTTEVNSKGKAVADKIYADEGQKELLPNINFTPNTIYLEYLKDVTKVPTAFKGKTVFSTQLRKLILSNLYNRGLITNTNHTDALKAYENTVDEYGNLMKMELLNDIGYELKDGKYIGNFTEFLKVIQSELTRRDLPDHHIEFVNANPDNSLKTDLSLHLKSDDIEKILVALMEKRLVRQKIKGEGLVQVSSAMTNGLWDNQVKFDEANEDEVRKYMGSNNLPFYDQTAEGTTAMKVAIALQGDFVNLLNVKHNDGQPIGTRQRLNQMIKDDVWMAEHGETVSLSAVRIPVQGLNSMEYMQVWDFLDPAAGNIIIPPSEIVAKSGADFDVDKLTTFMPAISKDGKFIKSEMTNEAIKRLIADNKNTPEGKAIISRVIKQQKAALENRLITNINNILKLPENFASLVRPNDTYLLKDDVVDAVDSDGRTLEDKVADYNRFNNYHGEGQRKGTKLKRSISPTRTLEPMYNLHKHEANMIGKDVLGLVAIYNALHPVMNSLGAAMPLTYKNSEYDKVAKKYVEGNTDLETRLFVPHNINAEGRISLSDTTSADGIDLISDLYSQLINGTVDVEKDAWIFFIQANMELAPMLLMLFKAGVPKEYAIKFISQPLIREYAKEQRLLNGSYADLTSDQLEEKKGSVKKRASVNVLNKFTNVKNPSAFVKNIGNKYAAVTTLTEKAGVLNSEGFFDLQSLDDMLKDPGNPRYKEKQLAVFMHFLELEDQFSGFQDLLRLANPDTTTSKTTQEMMLRNTLLDEMVNNSKVDSGLVKKLRNESILGTFYDNKIITDLIEPLFPLKNNKAVSQYILDSLLNSGMEISKTFGTGQDGKRQFITQFKNGVVNSLFQNAMYNYAVSPNTVLDIPTELIEKYFTPDVFFVDSDFSFADDLLKVIEDNKTLKEKYNILNQLSKPELKDGQQIITLNDNKLLKDGALAEAYYDNIKALSDPNVKKVEDTEKNLYISNMFKLLPLMAIYQNGVGYSKYGFNEALPFDDFLAVMQPVSEGFIKSENKQVALNNVFDALSDFKNKFFRNYVEVTPGRAITKPTQPSTSVKPKGEKVADGIYVNQEGLTIEEELELFNIIKPVLEQQAVKSNSGKSAPKMAGLSLNWDYTNGPTKRRDNGYTRVNVGKALRPNNTYGWFSSSVDGQKLYPITGRLIELMSKATGIDVTNYDGAIINIYNSSSFIGNHPDIDESVTAKNYPVVVVNIGGPGNIVLGVDRQAIPSVQLKSGAGYVFGFKGANRTIPHSTYASPIKGTLPAITTQMDGETIEAGSYRISITIRRVMPLEPGMPSEPAIVSTQSSTSVKPTIDTSRQWSGDLKTRLVYTSEGVNTMRTEAAKADENFGNPFSEAGYGNTIKVDSIADAVLAYKDWLLNGVTLVKTTNKVNLDTYLKPFEAQRTWILNQINQGKLDGATLLYAGKLAARGQGMHPTALADVVEQLRSTQPSTQPIATGKQVTYAPVGKQRQTYTIRGTQIFNKAGVEVFKTDSVDRNKIFANLAIKEGRAVVVEYNGNKYAVNKKNQIISGISGKIMNWPENSGDRKTVLAKAAEEFGTSVDPIVARKTEILNSPEFKSWLVNELSKNPNLDAENALDYYIKCKGL